MTKKQIRKIEMYNAVQAYLNANASIWNQIPMAGMLKEEFDALVAEINQNKESQEASRLFLGDAKRRQKRIVANKADILNSALETHAAYMGDIELEQKAARSFSKIYGLRNEDFSILISETISLLQNHQEALIPYGVTTEMIADLETSYDKFQQIKGKPRQLRISTSQATKSLKRLFKNTSTLLTNRLDNVMKLFKQTNLNFYNGYVAARVIVDT
ncbi:hypothetical protein [Aquimarina litoralis]|uniref:hypothetical protein n=1 Tax=Aquimarina litoralis TaxID=584605 RepID=UPI001C586FA8|nr:hypothetical protein [Aquimarina litoralis]MBW1297929.1 hypothetical protein [Aquimarina litoralis]